MKLFRKLLTPLIVLVQCNNCIGQGLSDFQVPEFYTNRLKTISSFMQRFNRQEIPAYMDSSAMDLPYMQVASCFQVDSFRNKVNEVIEFAQNIVDSNIKLSYPEQNYYCELECGATYMGDSTSIILRMVVDKTPQGFYTWSIADAEGDVLKIIPHTLSQSMYLSPVDDDQYFLELRDVLKERTEDILAYSFSCWTIDETSTFMAMVAAGLLKVQTITDVRYVFDAGEYIFKVHCVNRETNNNGWLIYEIKKK